MVSRGDGGADGGAIRQRHMRTPGSQHRDGMACSLQEESAPRASHDEARDEEMHAELATELESVRIPEESLVVTDTILGEGAAGRVYRAILQRGNTRLEVAAKVATSPNCKKSDFRKVRSCADLPESVRMPPQRPSLMLCARSAGGPHRHQAALACKHPRFRGGLQFVPGPSVRMGACPRRRPAVALCPESCRHAVLAPEREVRPAVEQAALFRASVPPRGVLDPPGCQTCECPRHARLHDAQAD